MVIKLILIIFISNQNIEYEEEEKEINVKSQISFLRFLILFKFKSSKITFD